MKLKKVDTKHWKQFLIFCLDKRIYGDFIMLTRNNIYVLLGVS